MTHGSHLHDRRARRLRDAFFHQGHRGRAVRRGNVRLAILAVLADGPMHGYQIIGELEQRTGGRWRPSAGSVYPTLQMLEDQGMVTAEEVEGRRTYRLTEAGRAAAAETPEPWGEGGSAGEELDLRRLAMGVIGAAIQVKRIGSPTANAAAREVLVDARRRLYAILAEDNGEATA